MSAIAARQQEIMQMFPLCAHIDLRLKQLSDISIFLVGLSRSGKSTLFNYINSIQLIGVAPEGPNGPDDFGLGIATTDVNYIPRIKSSQTAEANNGMKSVTLLPNIVDRVDYTLVDLPGFLDQRRYSAVVGVSYAIKAAFQKTSRCQFVLVLKFDYFRNASQLFKAFQGFVNMFKFGQMSPQSKENLMKSTTFVVTKSPINVKPEAYINTMKRFVKQGQDTLYGQSENVKKLLYALEYFCNHIEQIYLFKAAEINQIAPPCKIVDQHFKQRVYFQLNSENIKFKSQTKYPIFRLPFEEDYKNMPKQEDKLKLQDEIKGRINSFKKFAKILESFFQKAIIARNLIDQNLSFADQFKLIEQYNKQYNVYPQGFNLEEQTHLNTVFSQGDPLKKIRIGINLAQQVFQLYNLFNEMPQYVHQQDPSTLQIFMQRYETHLLEIIELFRNAFCTKWSEEQAILTFLFIGCRGCKQFSGLYQFRPSGKHDMCLQLKDSFQAIVNAQTSHKIIIKFINEISANIEQITKQISADKQQIEQYVKFFKHLPDQEGGVQICDTNEYKKLKKTFIKLIGEHSLTTEQALVSKFQNFQQHKKTVQDKLNELNDEEGEYPEQLNFTFIHLLSSMGKILLNLDRNQIIDQDNYAYDRKSEIERKKGKYSAKQYLKIEQAGIAKDIFSYIGDVKSVIECFQLILKNIPESEYATRISYMKGMAGFCLKHCRFEQAITIYQELLQICAQANLCQEYQNAKDLLAKIPLEREEKMKIYFNDLKQKHIIDPADDRQLDDITQSLQNLFIDPYQNRPKDA